LTAIDEEETEILNNDDASETCDNKSVIGAETEDEDAEDYKVKPTSVKATRSEVYAQYSEKLLPMTIPMLTLMSRWVKESDNMTGEDDVRNSESDGRKFVALALAILSACPGTAIRRINESTREIKSVDE
jgi:hypothetical protein